MDVGFIGLGSMGLAMAANLAKAGHRVHAWNRSPIEQREGLAIVGTPAEAFEADAVFTMLADDSAIRDVLIRPGVIARAPKQAIHIVSATISIDLARELSGLHAEAGTGFVSAPVSGRPDVAEAAQLAIVAAGAEAAIARVQPLFDAIGRRTWVMGTDPAQANAAKVAGNMMLALAIEAMAEAVAITETNGVAADRFLPLMFETLFGCRAYENYGRKIIDDDYDVGFTLRLGLKDLGLAGAAAGAVGKPLPLLDAVRARMQAAADAGMDGKDWSAMAAYTLGR